MNPAQCRAARAWLDWTQAQLARNANVSVSTIKDLEAAKRNTNVWLIRAIREAFEDAGVVFIHSYGIAVDRSEQGELFTKVPTQNEQTTETETTTSPPRVRSVG